MDYLQKGTGDELWSYIGALSVIGQVLCRRRVCLIKNYALHAIESRLHGTVKQIVG